MMLAATSVVLVFADSEWRQTWQRLSNRSIGLVADDLDPGHLGRDDLAELGQRADDDPVLFRHGPGAETGADGRLAGEVGPRRNWWQLIDIGVAAGVGFTMALLITGLSFGASDRAPTAKRGTFAASMLAGVVGELWLVAAGNRQPDTSTGTQATEQEQSAVDRKDARP